jgi:pilus assembly protein Flp/PilA
MRLFKDLLRDDSGATSIEYTMIAALISVAIVASANALGVNLSVVWGTVAAGMPAP